MSNTADRIENMSPPEGAQEVFYGLAALAFVVMAGFIFAYGLFGETVTRGLDQACAEAALLAGQRHEAAGNYEPALMRYREAMEGRFADPARRHACGLAIGDLLMRQQRYAEAIEAYEELPEAAFTSAGAYTGYVTALWRDGRFEEAAVQGERWLALAESDENRQQTEWAQATLMRVAEAMGDDAAALRHGEAAVAQNAANDAQLVLARILHRQGRTADALARLDAFIAASGDAKLLSDAHRLRDRIATGA